jgi:hypothetical protein
MRSTTRKYRGLVLFMFVLVVLFIIYSGGEEETSNLANTLSPQDTLVTSHSIKHLSLLASQSSHPTSSPLPSLLPPSPLPLPSLPSLLPLSIVENTCDSTAFDKPESSNERGILAQSKSNTFYKRFECLESFFGTNPSEEWKCIFNNDTWKWIYIFGSGCSKPFMQDDEIKLLSRTYANAKKVFEFGSGGSTRLAASLPTMELLVSVESDKIWASTSDLSIRNVSFVHEMHLIDLDSKAGDFGNPGSHATKENKEKYSSQLLFHPITDFDIVLVDGRFRVACVFSFILKELPISSRLIIHDYFDRIHYHIVNKYLIEIDKAGTSVVFKRKEMMTTQEKEEVKILFEKYKEDPR